MCAVHAVGKKWGNASDTGNTHAIRYREEQDKNTDLGFVCWQHFQLGDTIASQKFLIGNETVTFKPQPKNNQSSLDWRFEHN